MINVKKQVYQKISGKLRSEARIKLGSEINTQVWYLISDLVQLRYQATNEITNQIAFQVKENMKL
jgi:hypothetical protein